MHDGVVVLHSCVLCGRLSCLFVCGVWGVCVVLEGCTGAPLASAACVVPRTHRKVCACSTSPSLFARRARERGAYVSSRLVTSR